MMQNEPRPTLTGDDIEYALGYQKGQEDGKKLTYDMYLLGRSQMYRHGYAAGNADARKAVEE